MLTQASPVRLAICCFYSQDAATTVSIHAQQDHKRVVISVLNCLDLPETGVIRLKALQCLSLNVRAIGALDLQVESTNSHVHFGMLIAEAQQL